MDDTYKSFIQEGELIYPSPPDSLEIFPGKNRIKISWIMEDPTVSKVKIFWNNRTDSLELPVEIMAGIDTVTATLESMEENIYTFHLYSYDDQGNQSVVVSASGKVYGSKYEQSLLTRLPRSALFGYDTLKISWDNPVNETDAGTRIAYIDTSGQHRYATISSDSNTINIGDYDFDANNGRFYYETSYLPDVMAIDTFYSAKNSMQVTKLKVVADNHNYIGVFADDGLDPNHIFFLGYPRGQTQEMVWKYDLEGDSLLTGYPKDVSEEFILPYPDKIPEISSVGWFYFEDTSPKLQCYFLGNGYYYTYDLQTQEAGPLHDITDISTQPWPSKNFPKEVECAFYSPARRANYPFSGGFYQKLSTDAKRKWGYSEGRITTNVWKGIPADFIERGFNGMYYIESSRTAYFFSADEFIIFDEQTLKTVGDAKKIISFYKGL